MERPSVQHPLVRTRPNPVEVQLRQRDWLLAILRAMTGQLELEEVLRQVLQGALELGRAHAGLVLLQTEEGRPRAVAVAGIPERRVRQLERVLPTLAYQGVEAGDGGPRWGWLGEGVEALQVLLLPLRMGEEELGAIYLFRPRDADPFSPDELELLQTFADHAAVAVHNAYLHRRLRLDHQRLQAILENTADGLMIIDGQWRIVGFNQALEALTGWRREEVLGKTCGEVFALQDREGNVCAARCPLVGLRAGELPPLIYAEGQTRTRDGRPRFVGITYAPFFDEAGRFQGAIGSVRDITPLKEAQREKDLFIASVSHELKTPVAIIKGYAETLAREDARWDRQTLRQGLQAIQEEADRLNRLLDDLLEASRIQAGLLQLEPGPVDLASLLERLVRDFQAQTERHTLQLHLEADLPPVRGDGARLRHIFENLLSNALKYSPAGGAVQVEARRVDDGWVEVQVRDQGVGIPPDELPHIFDPFYRTRSEMRDAVRGVGLGLYIARALVEAHGGKIWAESQVGRGSTFHVRLPVWQEEEAPPPPHRPPPAEADAPRGEP